MAYQYNINLNASIEELETVKIMFFIASKHKHLDIRDIFVAGCGDGTEASAIRNSLRLNVVGVDTGLLEEYQDETLKVLNRDLMKLDFNDNSFGLIYSYHVLEHVSNPNIVLEKLSNMLRNNGILLVGFPNKKRLIGYLGSKNASTWEKIKWNMFDYKDRLLLKFENKYGAHAGFSQNEFITIAKPIFSKIISINDEYYLSKYNNNKIIKYILRSFLHTYFLPSNYFICFK